MENCDLIKVLRESRSKGTSSPFIGVTDRESEIDHVLSQLEASLVTPFQVEVVDAYYPQENCPFLHSADIFAIAKASEEFLLYKPKEGIFAKGWETGDKKFTILGFSSGDAIAEWRG